jgi:hypothetical protein
MVDANCPLGILPGIHTEPPVYSKFSDEFRFARVHGTGEFLISSKPYYSK